MAAENIPEHLLPARPTFERYARSRKPQHYCALSRPLVRISGLPMTGCARVGAGVKGVC